MVADVKLMPKNVLKVLHRCLPPFLSYGENPAGGGDIRPTPTGCGLTNHLSSKRLGQNPLIFPTEHLDQAGRKRQNWVIGQWSSNEY